MNAEQKERLIEAIETGATVRHFYRDKEGNTCAVGSMAEHAHLRTPRWGDAENGSAIWTDTARPMAVELCRLYGLTVEQLTLIQTTNDMHDLAEERRKAIIALVNSWMVEE